MDSQSGTILAEYFQENPLLLRIITKSTLSWKMGTLYFAHPVNYGLQTTES